MNRLIAMLESACATYCEMDDRYSRHSDSETTLDAGILREIVEYARVNDLHLDLLSGDATAFLDKYMSLLDGVSHTWVVPVTARRDPGADNTVYVAGIDQFNLVPNGASIAIVKYASNQLDGLMSVVNMAFTRAIHRVNFALTNLVDLDEQFIPEYRDALKELAQYCVALMDQGDAVEVDMLTDRLFLQEMNNCSAGETHLTVAPNGRVYPCPSFFHAQSVSFPQGNPADFDYGQFCEDSLSPRNKNLQLFSFRYAPICQACDANQCRRCSFLSWVKTLEVCVPSRIQCLKANCEREATRYMCELMRDARLPTRLGAEKMEELRYPDPLEFCAKHGFPLPGQKLDEMPGVAEAQAAREDVLPL